MPEIMLVIFLSLMMLSAVYAVRDAFGPLDAPEAKAPRRALFDSPDPHRVKVGKRDKISVKPPAPPAELAVAPAEPAPSDSSAAGSSRALKLSK